MADLSLLPNSSACPCPLSPWQQRCLTHLAHIATAVGAVLGLWATAQGAVGSSPSLADGTYLYGESPVADTIGATYLVFEVQNSRLTGGLYQPSSSFDCVHGTVDHQALNLTVVDAYDQGEWTHQVALTRSSTALATTTGGAVQTQVQGMYRLPQLSPLDHHISATCTQ